MGVEKSRETGNPVQLRTILMIIISEMRGKSINRTEKSNGLFCKLTAGRRQRYKDQAPTWALRLGPIVKKSRGTNPRLNSLKGLPIGNVKAVA